MKKILFIQPYYFYGGHYYELFNHLIKKLNSFDYYDFLVSINNHNKQLKTDFENIKKIKKIKTFNSPKNGTSIKNIIKSFFIILFLRKKYSIFFYYDGDVTIFSIFYFFFYYFLKDKKIIFYSAFDGSVLNKVKYKRIKFPFLRFFLKSGKNQIFVRTNGHRDTWRTFFPKLKEKINIIKTLDYPEIINTNSIKNKKLKFGVIGQIRFGKSLEFLNDFFKKQSQYDFKIIGSFANRESKKNFEFIEKKFLLEQTDFLPFNDMINETRKLDYILLLYDEYVNLDSEVTIFYIASKLRIPIIFSKKQNFLRNIFQTYKCGIMLDNLDQFLDFPNTETEDYKNFQKNLIKFDEENLNTEKNEKIFYDTIVK